MDEVDPDRDSPESKVRRHQDRGGDDGASRIVRAHPTERVDRWKGCEHEVHFDAEFLDRPEHHEKQSRRYRAQQRRAYFVAVLPPEGSCHRHEGNAGDPRRKKQVSFTGGREDGGVHPLANLIDKPRAQRNRFGVAGHDGKFQDQEIDRDPTQVGDHSPGGDPKHQSPFQSRNEPEADR